ncbi:hypothetical protein GH714_041980 [Hevea brasiliensis]|uniref:Uncharacterized protein n=1 Tax=Hevea brasiliensis TaxID=3981 RepID=A0A6A6MXQ0_HEVBR|nr:hypothetical protein GH714_041980 [Hevea brasiliensis]
MGYPLNESSSLIAFHNFGEEMKHPVVWESDQGKRYYFCSRQMVPGEYTIREGVQLSYASSAASNEEDEEMLRALAASMKGVKDINIMAADNKDATTAGEEEGSCLTKKPTYPPLPEEPRLKGAFFAGLDFVFLTDAGSKEIS